MKAPMRYVSTVVPIDKSYPGPSGVGSAITYGHGTYILGSVRNPSTGKEHAFRLSDRCGEVVFEGPPYAFAAVKSLANDGRPTLEAGFMLQSRIVERFESQFFVGNG